MIMLSQTEIITIVECGYVNIFNIDISKTAVAAMMMMMMTMMITMMMMTTMMMMMMMMRC